MPSTEHRTMETRTPPQRHAVLTFGGGSLIGALGGLIGLGGAEFRLPLLIGVFRFRALEAVVLNKAMSLVVVAAALPLRASSVPVASVIGRLDVIAILLSGSLGGAWFGAGLATRLNSRTLHRVISGLLLGIAMVLLGGHDAATLGSSPIFTGTPLIAVGVVAGFGIGLVASILGVAGGELLIPTLVLLFGVDLKLAGSLSLAISLPTMITAFARYSRDRSFVIIREQRRFIAIMAAGSLVGAYLGSRLLDVVPNSVLLPFLAIILVISAIKVWRHAQTPDAEHQPTSRREDRAAGPG